MVFIESSLSQIDFGFGKITTDKYVFKLDFRICIAFIEFVVQGPFNILLSITRASSHYGGIYKV